MPVYNEQQLRRQNIIFSKCDLNLNEVLHYNFVLDLLIVALKPDSILGASCYKLGSKHEEKIVFYYTNETFNLRRL